MKLKINFPKDLYSDIRIIETVNMWYNVENSEAVSDSDKTEVGAMIRVFDGNMWYTSSTNDISSLQSELDSLAELASPNPEVNNHPYIKGLEANKNSVLIYNKENDMRNITRDDLVELTNYYIDKCVDPSISEINIWGTNSGILHKTITYYSSKGAEIEYDTQKVHFYMGFGITVDGVTYYCGKGLVKFNFDEIKGHEDKILTERDKYIDYAHNSVQIEPGEYECILSPIVTAMFTHESFGHKSEADFMLNDETLRAEWIMGKKVGSDIVSICDDGTLLNNGYLPYDDEGSKTKPTWLIKDGILTGRLHDAKSAAALDEELTGNSRAQDYNNFPVVRMTNTYMAGGNTDPEKMLSGVKDGIYVDGVDSGTGQATFTMRPSLCYRIRDGKKCEPVRVNVINGSVFQTLFDIVEVGNDFQIFDTFTCGKNGQSVNVSSGGSSIHVKKLTFN